MWEHFSHDADVGIRGRGATRDQAFAEAGRALTAAVTDPDSVAPRLAVKIRCQAPDDELLLVEWLNALVYEMATRHMLFARFEVAITEAIPEAITEAIADRRRLTATAWGEPIDVARHQPAVEAKGATMTALRVAREPDGSWLAQTVLDV